MYESAPTQYRALNGLGYMYYYGQGVEKNVTTAFSYFARAAAMQQDGDSLYNTGRCYAKGTGTERNMLEAKRM